jgi:transposase
MGMSLEVAEEWIGRQTPEVQAVVRMMLARIAELESELAKLRERINKSPQNSSLPPSSQHPHGMRPSGKTKSTRKRGGQPGHPKRERPLLPPEQCNQVHTLKPHECRRCRHRLNGADAEPLRHQVWELPEIKPIVTEYQRHRLSCPRCGASTCAALPPGVPTSQAGPRLTALTALLMGCFRQSKRRVALFLEQILGQPCSPGWVVKLQRRAMKALRPNWNELAGQLPFQDNLGIDETATKEAAQKSWLWDFVAKKFTVFALRPTRAATVLEEILGGKFRGVANCDRAKMYWSLGRLQWCWAHLKRDFQALVDSADRAARRLGHDLLRPTGELFRHWSRYRNGALSRRGFVRSMQPVRTKIENLLLRGAYSGNDAMTGMCNELYDHREWLWNFVEVPGVEPTNNVSERALRPAVIWRKLSFGTQSEGGSRFVETMLTVVETCRQQGRNIFDHLVKALESHLVSQPPPSLLPGA